MAATANQPANPGPDQGVNPTANPLPVTGAKYRQLRAMDYAGRVQDLSASATRQWLAERAPHWILASHRGATAFMPVVIFEELVSEDRQRAAANLAATLPAATVDLLANTTGSRVVLADRPWATAELCRELVRYGAVEVFDGRHDLTPLGAAVRDLLSGRH